MLRSNCHARHAHLLDGGFMTFIGLVVASQKNIIHDFINGSLLNYCHVA